MRVIGGEARGRTLRSPSGRTVRPTADRVREAVFNILQGAVAGSRFLDLCAGTGAVGIEALSRGASSATFVEFRRPHVAIIRSNLETCGFSDRARVLESDVLEAVTRLSGADERYSLIFLDPPFDAGELRSRTLRALGRLTLLEPEGRILAEFPARDTLPRIPGLTDVREARYGEIGIGFYRRTLQNEPDLA